MLILYVNWPLQFSLLGFKSYKYTTQQRHECCNCLPSIRSCLRANCTTQAPALLCRVCYAYTAEHLHYQYPTTVVAFYSGNNNGIHLRMQWINEGRHRPETHTGVFTPGSLGSLRLAVLGSQRRPIPFWWPRFPDPLHQHSSRLRQTVDKINLEWHWINLSAKTATAST